MVGLAFGFLIALLCAGTMKSMLFGLKPRDPITFFIATVMVMLISLAASFLPARQRCFRAAPECKRYAQNRRAARTRHKTRPTPSALGSVVSF